MFASPFPFPQHRQLAVWHAPVIGPATAVVLSHEYLSEGRDVGVGTALGLSPGRNKFTFRVQKFHGMQ